MRLVLFAIILGVISMIPMGIWISVVIFSVWLLYKLKNSIEIQIEIIHHKEQNEYDDEILKEMK